MYQPEATYRIQFHKDFTFRHLKEIIPYLQQLGIKTIYASPVFAAVPGSAHGYDGIDPNMINPEIGTLDEFRDIVSGLQQRNIGWMQDFVPNHMAFTPQNKWLCDFLEKGKMSCYDLYFDKNPDEQLMVPFLGATWEEVLDKKELSLVFYEGKLQFCYYAARYPLNYTAYYDILDHEHFDSFPFGPALKEIDLLSQITDKDEFQEQWEEMKNTLHQQLSEERVLASFREVLNELSDDRIFMQRLADQQFYRLCFWKETFTKINYRRFFTINSLICMNMQREDVFDDYHQLLGALVKEGLIQGVRIDHVDGLYDPATYLQRLREKLGPDVYIVVEKILEQKESLEGEWPVQGSTGYDFLAQVNQVLIRKDAEEIFTTVYRKMAPDELPVPQQVFYYKGRILGLQMQGELSNLLREFKALPERLVPEYISDEALQKVIAMVLICCPVYRFYPEAIPLSGKEEAAFSALMASVRMQVNTDVTVLGFFLDHFLVFPQQYGKAYKEKLLHFWRRCMQLSGPLMAKGVEDTLMYNDHSFIARNEVGDITTVFGMVTEDFHWLMQQRQKHFPSSMNATATHDTKRGEDTRARLQLLSAVPALWFEAVKEWIVKAKGEELGLEMKDRYFVMQAIYGALPFKEEGEDHFKERLKAYLPKAAREAKTHSSWEEPDIAYEDSLVRYALTVADAGSKAGKAMRKFLATQQQAIVINSLAQLTLKCTCPGIPDIYQGTEDWDLSLVDPDNRRPVDYASRAGQLERLTAIDFDPLSLMDNISDPAIKQYTLYRLLQLRKTFSSVFSSGTYEPVNLGKGYLSFIRRYKEKWIWVVVPLEGKITKPDKGWALPPEAPLQWRHLFSHTLKESTALDIEEELRQFPVMVCTAELQDNKRSAGILMPLFSLPSDYGIGGMGKEAYAFLDFLSRSGQKIWQLLPLNPVTAENSYSPYASVSAFAGEPLYIDPDLLAEEGLLTRLDMEASRLPALWEVDYESVQQKKVALLQKAWSHFKTGKGKKMQDHFDAFCRQEKNWLDDYALFVVLKNEHNGKPWYQWEQAYRDREGKALSAFRMEHQDAIAYEQWLQFVFFKQWKMLSHYAKQRNIRLMGDVPFYMSNDSAEVWAKKHLFNIDALGKVKAMAGVPPDYFSATGQLWGMPTYNWEAMHKENYSWWIDRLNQNVALYDLVRLDHFRAFFDYWEIQEDATTAINGTWKEGPQGHLFDLLQQHFPTMPFIAEDLGEIHQQVFDFRDRYHLPGMRVLQFGFNPYSSRLRDVPHNFSTASVVYTGTHDNNTALGWYKGLSDADRESLMTYLGYAIDEKNVADALCHMAFASVAAMLILPLQDVLGLDDDCRINTPSTIEGNWEWRLLPGKLYTATEQRLLNRVKLYNR